MSMKSFLLTLGIFCGGYASNTLLDNALAAADSYFHLSGSTYKTDANGYIICRMEKPNNNSVGILSRQRQQICGKGLLALRDGDMKLLSSI
jgi:hypothetical protein